MKMSSLGRKQFSLVDLDITFICNTFSKKKKKKLLQGKWKDGGKGKEGERRRGGRKSREWIEANSIGNAGSKWWATTFPMFVKLWVLQRWPCLSTVGRRWGLRSEVLTCIKSSELQRMLHVLSCASLLTWLLTLTPVTRDQISETLDVLLLCDRHCLFESSAHSLFG